MFTWKKIYLKHPTVGPKEILEQFHGMLESCFSAARDTELLVPRSWTAGTWEAEHPVENWVVFSNIFLCSPLLGEMIPIWLIIFNGVGSTTN